MADFLPSFLIVAGVLALVAIGPWLRVVRAKDERAASRALPLAATGTILFLGAFVLFAGAIALAELI